MYTVRVSVSLRGMRYRLHNACPFQPLDWTQQANDLGVDQDRQGGRAVVAVKSDQTSLIRVVAFERLSAVESQSPVTS